jgi:DNA-binding beta-propeller fold protein YncE
MPRILFLEDRVQRRWRYLNSFLLAGAIVFIRPMAAQTIESADAALQRRIEQSPTLPFIEEQFAFHFSSPGWAVGPVSGVAADEKGTIYVMQRGDKADPILAFDMHGTLLRSWGKGDFTSPHSLRVDLEGNVWAVDAGASLVIKYSPAGKRLLTIVVGQVPDTGSPFRGATDVAFAPNGHVLIADGYGNARILEYTSDGKRIQGWGQPGMGLGEFHLPHAIQISRDGIVYVADRENGRIEEFNMRGKFLKEIGQLGRCYSLRLAGGFLWASMSPLGEDPGAPGWLVKLDPNSGKFLGHLNVSEQREGHQIDILPSGEPVVTAGNGLLLFHSPVKSSP